MISKLFICIVIISLSLVNSTYDPTMGVDLINMSGITHCPDDQILKWNCRFCTDHRPNMKDITILFDKKYQARGFAGYDPDANQIVVSFRGVVGATNLGHCFDYKLIDVDFCEGCKIHRGVYKTYLSIQKQIIETVIDLKTQYVSAQLIITGHSMGGGLAAIASLDLLKYLGQPDLLMTFGSLRIGNEQLADYLNAQIDNVWRVVHYRDLIPHLPTMDMGYRHYANQVWYDDEDSSKYVICQGGEDPKCSDSVKFWQLKLSDHSNYLGFYIGLWFKC